MVSSTNFKVAHDCYSIVSVSTIVEGSSDQPERQLEPGFVRIGLGSGYLGRNEEKYGIPLRYLVIGDSADPQLGLSKW